MRKDKCEFCGSSWTTSEYCTGVWHKWARCLEYLYQKKYWATYNAVREDGPDEDVNYDDIMGDASKVPVEDQVNGNTEWFLPTADAMNSVREIPMKDATRILDEALGVYQFEPGATYVLWWEEKMNPEWLASMREALNQMGIRHMLIDGCKMPKMFVVNQKTGALEEAPQVGRKFRMEEEG